MQRIGYLIICSILLVGCKPVRARFSELIPLSLDYDNSPDNIVIYADVQPYPGAPEPGEECLATYQPQLRIFGDGLVYLNIASGYESQPLEWEGKFDESKITELLMFLKKEGFFNSWNLGEINPVNPAGTGFRMGANLEATQVVYEGGGALDPPLYHTLIHEKVLPSLTPLSESGKNDERIAAILRAIEDCHRRINE
jgi:hypothetical protein